MFKSELQNQLTCNAIYLIVLDYEDSLDLSYLKVIEEYLIGYSEIMNENVL